MRAAIGLLNMSVFQKKGLHLQPVAITEYQHSERVLKEPQIADLWQNILKHNDRILIHHALHIYCRSLNHGFIYEATYGRTLTMKWLPAAHPWIIV